MRSGCWYPWVGASKSSRRSRRAEWGADWDLVVLSGGLDGVAAVEADARLMALLTDRIAAGGLTAAICAAPRVLANVGLDPATPVTGHPGCKADLEGFDQYREDAVVDAGKVITSRGPGTAVAFGLACVAALCGAEKAAEVRVQIVA